MLLLGQVVICDALIYKIRMGFNAKIRHQNMVYLCCGLIFIDVSWNAALHLKEVIRISIDLVCGSRRKSHHQRVKVIENGTILLKNGTMGFINND